MTTYAHVVTSSKLLLVAYCTSEEEAITLAAEWDALAPVGTHDAESPATIYTWEEWVKQ